MGIEFITISITTRRGTAALRQHKLTLNIIIVKHFKVFYKEIIKHIFIFFPLQVINAVMSLVLIQAVKKEEEESIAYKN